MARFMEIAHRSFSYKKDATKWAKEEKKKLTGQGVSVKWDVNYTKDGQWKAVVMRKV